MAVSIKNKIRSGTLFLFMLLVISGGLGIYYLLQLKNDSKNIIRANYESLVYCHQMQQQLDSAGNAAKFEVLLKAQENNVTENGEKEQTQLLRNAFEKWRQGDTGAVVNADIRHRLQAILQLNMEGIQRKNVQAQHTAEKASNVIIMLAVLTFLIGLVFSVNFPAVVVTPIKKLMEAIKEISARNYQYRIHLDTNDEFKQLGDAFNDMSERLEEFENSNLNKLIFEKARAEAVVNSLKDATIGIDKQGRLLFANQQALSLLSLTAAEVVGRSVEAVSEKNDLFKFLISDAGTAPFKIVVDDRENYYVKEVLQVPQGETENTVIIVKNITSFKELDVAKTNFIATVSHELKTPLASSDLSLKLLTDSRVGNLSGEQQELVQQLKDDNQRMLKILSELLNMSQVEAGKIQLHITNADLNTLVDISIAVVANAAKEKHINIEKHQQPLPQVACDADKINWVINNFLTNAIKFSPEQSRIIISAYRHDKRVYVEVKDEGPGIAEMYYNRIFERYFQVPGRADKKGSGIGLAICREMILAMGGNIWVKSTPGEGSTFGFDLPVNT